jgi:hypothetical protein
MRAFEVSLNGKKLCLAGISDDGVLTAVVNWVPRKGKGDPFLQVGGLVGPSDEHVSWGGPSKRNDERRGRKTKPTL